jgi:hypothetical protein
MDVQDTASATGSIEVRTQSPFKVHFDDEEMKKKLAIVDALLKQMQGKEGSNARAKLLEAQELLVRNYDVIKGMR